MTLINVLLTNALSTGISGMILALLPNFFANLFKVNTPQLFKAFGIFFVIFSLFVFTAALKNPIQKNWVKIIIVLDISWVLGSLITAPILFSFISIGGSIVLLIVAGWVALMAYLQIKTIQNL